jgi:PPK2 family polyphosphate:nucleotide phosphotransferase
MPIFHNYWLSRLARGRLLVDKPCMPVQGARERYLVKHGSKVDLGKIDAQEKALFGDGSKLEHEPHFDKLRTELQELQKVLYAQNQQRVLVVLQAMDTGGKDGCIRNVFSRIDPQGIHVCSFKKPSTQELAHDFLWRIHSKVPANGEIVIFNRSHYEDIIAVRVKNIFPQDVWSRRYRHVMDFERMLAEEGTTLVKIFLHISKDEQKQRLEGRLANPGKHWKMNPDDLSDRTLWGDFMQAYEDVISRTSMPHAPWYVVPSNRKWYRDLCVARIIVDTLKGLNMKFPPINWDPDKIKVAD